MSGLPAVTRVTLDASGAGDVGFSRRPCMKLGLFEVYHTSCRGSPSDLPPIF